MLKVKTQTSNFLVETIDSSDSTSEYRFAHVTGLSENVTHPFIRDRVSGVYSELPFARAISLGQNSVGFGIRGLDLKQFRDKEARATVAATRLSVLRASAKDNEKHILTGTSMGSIVVADMVEQNFRSDSPLDIAGVVLFGPALHTDKNHVIKNAIPFARQLIGDASRDLMTQSPRKLLKRSRGLVSWSGEAILALPHIIHQLGEIITASEVSTLHKTFETIPTVAVYGNKDDIVAHTLMQLMHDSYPAMFGRVIVPDKGHELLFDTELAVQSLVSGIQQSHMLRQ
ncbi:MAG: alpha/beta hydrolase [Candidatus Saccharimonadales bacterium]